MSQEQFARVVGVSPRTVSRWELAVSVPSSAPLKQLASYLAQRSMQALPTDVVAEYKRLQERASQSLHKAILAGRIQGHGPCVDCGSPAVHYDHRDYFQPLIVESVCSTCNTRRGLAIQTFTDHPVKWSAYDWGREGQERKPRRKFSQRLK